MLVSRTSHEKRTKLKQNAWLRPAVSDAMLAYDARRRNRRNQMDGHIGRIRPGNP